MTINIELMAVPFALGRSREKILALLASWAEKRSQRDFSIRLSGPVAIPGKEFQVWLLETNGYIAEFLLSDLAMFARATLLLRLNEESGEEEARQSSEAWPALECTAKAIRLAYLIRQN